ncbi:MAG: hypothetical protein PHW27_02855 [Melioribacteraceae bacterium]|nr:hypothetical protein [Melioribacteraceae bacterium]
MEEHKNAITYTLVNFLGSLFPIFASFLYLGFNKEIWLQPSQLISGGELLILCIPLSLGVVYTLFFFKAKTGSFGWEPLFFWITLFLLLGAIFIYASGYSRFGLTEQSSNYIITASVIFGIWTLVALYFSKFIENRNVEIKRSRKDDEKDLETKFDNLITKRK